MIPERTSENLMKLANWWLRHLSAKEKDDMLLAMFIDEYQDNEFIFQDDWEGMETNEE